MAASAWARVPGAPRAYDTHQFVGDPTGALERFGWRTTIPAEVGIARLVRAFRGPVEGLP